MRKKDTDAMVHFSSSEPMCHQHEKWTKAQRLWLKEAEGSGGIHWPSLTQGSPWIAPASPSAPRVQFVSHRQACVVGTGSPETQSSRRRGTVIRHSDSLVRVHTTKGKKNVED